MAEKDPETVIMSSSATRFYLSVEESLELLEKWIRIQTGSVAPFVKDIFSWLKREDYKIGGFYIHGPPGCGKSFIVNGLMDLFPFVGSIRPQPGNHFNFDDCDQKQVN